jgi:hypothetical protein
MACTKLKRKLDSDYLNIVDVFRCSCFKVRQQQNNIQRLLEFSRSWRLKIWELAFGKKYTDRIAVSSWTFIRVMMSMSSQESSSYGAIDSPGSPTMPSSATTYSSTTKEKPSFTFRHVGLIWERMLKEHKKTVTVSWTPSSLNSMTPLSSLHNVTCRAVAMQRPLDGRVYQDRLWATGR